MGTKQPQEPPDGLENRKRVGPPPPPPVSDCSWLHTVANMQEEINRLRAEVERLKEYLSQQIAASNNILDSEVDCDYRYEHGCLAALKRVQRFLDSEEE